LLQSKKRKELSALWTEIRTTGTHTRGPAQKPGSSAFISIKRARSFSGALAHALKYPAKFLTASTPARLAELEATFHRTRRFSATAAFYNVEVTREPGDESPVGECPLCGARLCEVMEPWVPRCALETEGRCALDQARREAGRAKVFSGAGPP
jgi:hypothetical protein